MPCRYEAQSTKEITRRTRCCSQRKERGQSERDAIAQESFGVWKFYIVRCGPSEGASIATHHTVRKCHQFLHRAPLNTRLLTFYMTESLRKRKNWETRKKEIKVKIATSRTSGQRKISRRQTIFSNWNRRRKETSVTNWKWQVKRKESSNCWRQRNGLPKRWPRPENVIIFHIRNHFYPFQFRSQCHPFICDLPIQQQYSHSHISIVVRAIEFNQEKWSETRKK